MTFFLDRKNNIEAVLSKKNVDFERASLEVLEKCEPLMCNQLWGEECKLKLNQHLASYYDSLLKHRKEKQDVPKTAYMNEMQVNHFYTVLQKEKVP